MTTIKLSTEELAAELTRREQDQAAEQERQAAVLAEAQQAWATDVIGRHIDLDQQLEAEGKQHYEAAVDAAKAMDLSKAFESYSTYLATRHARARLRSNAHGAANLSGYAGRILPDLSWVQPTFAEFLDQNSPVSELGEEIAWTHTKEQPTSYEEATAWLEANRGN